MRFNIVRYKELLVKDESSKTNEKEIFELSNYKTSIETQILWESKNEYLRLIHKYLDEKISPGKFRDEYCDMRDKNDEKYRKTFDNLDELSNFWINPEAKTVGSLLNKISLLCIFHEFGLVKGNEEDEFRKRIQNVVLEIKKYDSFLN